MLPDCRRLVGVEVVPQAVDGAKQTAARLGLDADRADFRCQDAGAAAAQLAAEGARPDVIVVDPPRKGCDEAALTAIAEMAPRTVVMVSCNAATAARDTKWLTEHGYKAVEVQPVDLFPRDAACGDGCFAFQGRNRLKEGAGGVLAGRYGYVRLPEGRDL